MPGDCSFGRKAAQNNREMGSNWLKPNANMTYHLKHIIQSNMIVLDIIKTFRSHQFAIAWGEYDETWFEQNLMRIDLAFRHMFEEWHVTRIAANQRRKSESSPTVPFCFAVLGCFRHVKLTWIRIMTTINEP